MDNIAGLVGVGSPYVLPQSEIAVISDVMDHRFRPMGDLLNALPARLRLPDSYLITDIETSGFDPNNDLIVEVGWGIVHNRKLIDCAGMILDWTQINPGNYEYQRWLRRRLEYVAEAVAAKGGRYHFTYERLQDEGVSPISGLADYARILWTFMRSSAYIVGHNLWNFDRKRINHATAEFLDNYQLPWHLSPVIDTGLIEKAAQIGKVPMDSETLEEWYRRVNGTWARTRWNLEGHCEDKYNLAERYHLDLRYAHTAGFDCLLNYALAETYRHIGDSHRGFIAD
jgi:hypothetical protein